MYFNKRTLALFVAASSSVTAFSPAATGNRLALQSSGAVVQQSVSCPARCNCPSCAGRLTKLFADVAEETEVPAEVEAMEGVESADEAHNLERPARAALKKKKPSGKDLSEFTEGTTVKGTIKSIASYGAFVDIGASTDGLLHVSQLSAGFVSDVSEVVSEGQEVDVRIVNIDSAKGQIGLSMMTEEEAAAAKPARRSGGNKRQGGRRDDSAVLGALREKGWDEATMVEGTVVSTVDFGAFVKVDASTLNSECEGSFDGLVHISALKVGRVGSVTDVVNANDTVKVRCKSIDGNKVSLTMLSVEEEEAERASGARSSGPTFNDPFDEGEGAKDWKESVAAIDEEQPVYKNTPLIIRK
ncbi:unnamed protein product [Pseudo-nitzschia multistriata]|uniref:S1 motif domain-containing protein n=1 Tax=Pseudo-nitzschia multistriata TaxID=183589 RepID=A0A448Z2C6_9STRA|nr:unnamed protein product [Pseudo-nitzschia multistriata]